MFLGLIVLYTKQNSHEIASAVKYTYDIYIFILNTVKYAIITANKIAVICFKTHYSRKCGAEFGKLPSIRMFFNILFIVLFAACSLRSSSVIYDLICCKFFIDSGENFISAIRNT